VRPAFNWIEVFAIPLSANIMETQPIVLLLFFVAVVFAGAGAPLPLGGAGITLLLLGLQWWAMFINYRLHQGMKQRTATILHISGVVFAFGLALLTNLKTFDLPVIFVIAGIVMFCWKRAIDKTKNKLYDEQLLFVFKLGVVTLLFILIVSVVSPSGPLQDVAATLGYALPLFFLSGLIALSFTRVSIIRRERQGIPQANLTRGWPGALTFLWGVMVLGALALETFSFRIIQELLLPIWNILAIIVSWIIYAVFWVILVIFQFLGWLFHFQPSVEKMPQAASQYTANSNMPPGMEQFPTWLILIGRLFLLAIVLLALSAIFRVILLHARLRLEQEGEEEIREILSMRSILRERQQERKSQAQQKEETLLDALDSGSVRALYRELLQQMAEHGERLSRRPEETPMEYQKRLFTLIESFADDVEQSDMVSDREMLADLTRAYIDERYGERQAELRPHDDPGWISRMAERLGRRIR
jgi:hypothetical protein